MAWSNVQQSPCGSIMQSSCGEFGASASASGPWYYYGATGSPYGSEQGFASNDGASWYQMPQTDTGFTGSHFFYYPLNSITANGITRLYRAGFMQDVPDLSNITYYPSSLQPICEMTQYAGLVIGAFATYPYAAFPGANVAPYYSSDNGATWTSGNVTLPPGKYGPDFTNPYYSPVFIPHFVQMNGMLFCYGFCNVGGSILTCWRTTDGINWLGSVIPPQPDEGKSGPYLLWKNNGTLYAQWGAGFTFPVGAVEIYSSTDGISWTHLTDTGPNVSIGNEWRTVALPSGTTLIQSASSTYYTTDNGLGGPNDWITRPPYTYGGVVFWNGALWVIDTSTRKLMTSTDEGVTWTAFEQTNLVSPGAVDGWLMRANETDN